jgi:transposase InsO family protein
MAKAYPLSVLCRVFVVSRSGYHAWRTRKASARQQANARLLAAIQQLHQGPERCYGSPRLTPELRALGHACSENRVARLMRRHGVRAQTRKRFVPRTTDSDHDHPIAPNRLAERLVPTAPNQVWVSDLTYVPTAQGWLYLALVMDLWSRRIVGWAMADHLRSELVLAALPSRIAAQPKAWLSIRIAACNTPAPTLGSSSRLRV